jgi:hypothetical protein
MFPILDTHVFAFYDRAAKAAAAQLAPQRSALGKPRRMYWEAIRRELIAHRETIAAIRHELLGSEDEIQGGVATHVPDSRLLDMLAWSAERNPK